MEANSAMERQLHLDEIRKTERKPVLRIEPSKGWAPLKIRELWEHRELIYFLAWSNVKIRYKQTVLGAAWAIIQPFMTMLVFSLFFGKLGRIPSDGLPYPLWSFAALVPWTFFSQALMQSANSLVMNQGLLRKVYFPRLAIPIGIRAPDLTEASFSDHPVDLESRDLGRLRGLQQTTIITQRAASPILAVIVDRAAMGQRRHPG